MSLSFDGLDSTELTAFCLAIEGDDAINIMADWDVFQVEMSNLYDGVSEDL